MLVQNKACISRLAQNDKVTLLKVILPLLLYALIFCWPLTDSLALEPREADVVSIGAVLADPQHYNLHCVQLQGRLTAITVLQNQGGCRTFDAYLFQFEDETGSIPHSWA